MRRARLPPPLSCPRDKILILSRKRSQGCRMVRAVLFDLDGTLLNINLERFLGRYFSALREVAVGYADSDQADAVMNAIQAAVRAMCEPHPDATNLHVFEREFERVSGTVLADVWPAYERFYAEVFPSLADGAGPALGAQSAVETALELGLPVAVATNPIFPSVAVRHRLAWAGLSDIGFSAITSYEDMYACKPHGAYFRQVAAQLGVDPTECIMVGDDRYLDLPAADVGMRTFYVGADEDAAADYRGTLEDFAALLPRLVATPDDV